MKKIKLSEARKNKNISQEKMASILSMNVSNYNRREKGIAKITTEQWRKIADALEVSLEEIYEADETMLSIFNDNSTGGTSFLNYYHIPFSIWETQKKYTKKLEEEVNYFKEELKKYKKD